MSSCELFKHPAKTRLRSQIGKDGRLIRKQLCDSDSGNNKILCDVSKPGLKKSEHSKPTSQYLLDVVETSKFSHHLDRHSNKQSAFKDISEALVTLSSRSEKVLLVCLEDIKMKHDKAAVGSDDVKVPGTTNLKAQMTTRTPRKVSPSRTDKDGIKKLEKPAISESDTTKSDHTASPAKRKGRKPKDKSEDENRKSQSSDAEVPSIVVTDTDKDSDADKSAKSDKVKPAIGKATKPTTLRKPRQSKEKLPEVDKASVDNTSVDSPIRKRKESASPVKSRTPSKSPNRTKRKNSPSTSSAAGSDMKVSPSSSNKSSPKKSPSKSSVQDSSSKSSPSSSSSSSSSSAESSPQKSTSSNSSVSSSPSRASVSKSLLKKTRNSTSLKKAKESSGHDSTGKKSETKSRRKGAEVSDEKSNDKSQESSAALKRTLRKNKDTPVKSDENTNEMSLKETSTVRALEFGEDVTVIEGLKMSIPSDFQYKYSSVLEKDGPLVLSDLITKVNSSIVGVNPDLVDLFGTASEPEYVDEDSFESSTIEGKSDESLKSENDKDAAEKEDISETVQETKTSTEAEHKNNCKMNFDDEIKDAGRSGEPTCDGVKSTETCEHHQTCDTEKGSDNENMFIGDKVTDCKAKPIVNDGNENKKSEKIEDKKVDTSCEIETGEKPKSIFEMFGLNLKRKTSVSVDGPSQSQVKEKTPEKSVTKSPDPAGVPKKKSPEVIEILSDDADDCKVISPSGAEGKRPRKRKSRVPSVHKTLEPKPLDILSKFEKVVVDKKSAFISQGLDKYIEINKDGDPTKEMSDSELIDDLAVEKFVPDFDELDGLLFLSFPNETALKGHIRLEAKYDWIKESTLKKIGQVQAMKARQQVAGYSRLTDAKVGEEQKYNYRGIPMKLMKYKKHLKSEVEELLDVKPKLVNDYILSKSASKTSDITKIKGWKNKFQNAEESPDAAAPRLPESGKLHWKTKERLLKSLDPTDAKDIGLDLKKKRRKLVNYSNKKKQKEGEYECLVDDECYITQKDVFNEDEYKDSDGKLPYSERFKSQYKYGARKMFVKKMKLDSVDERILKKLGTQKMASETPPVKEQKQNFLQKINTGMASVAVSALDKKLIRKARAMAKAAIARGKKNNQIVSRSKHHEDEPDGDEDGEEEEEYTEMEADYQDEEEYSDNETLDSQTKKEEDSFIQEAKGQTYRTRSRANSRSGGEQGQQLCDQQDVPGTFVTAPTSAANTPGCDQPGCRYGCICHLCKLSDSGEEKEADIKPPCDKEYCKLGCICESVETSHKVSNSHCKKPGCMLECKCPPKQPKPDIPREDGQRKKKKGRGKKKKSPTKEEEVEDVEMLPMATDGEHDDWEPPHKRKRVNNPRFANLPRRETTYRVAKNLDAVSRKAMEVYVSSEMYAEQKIRRRKSDNWPDQHIDDTGMQPLTVEFTSRKPGEVIPTSRNQGEVTPVLKKSVETTPVSRKSGETTPATKKSLIEKAPPSMESQETVMHVEISDESEDEQFPADMESCARTSLFTSNYNRSKPKADSKSEPVNKESVIDLVDSDNEAGGRKKGGRSKSRAQDTHPVPYPATASERLGIARRIAGSEKETKWRTQMVCLKAKKKSEDPSLAQSNEPEIKLLEIISNCAWESDRTNMLSKISQLISRDVQVNHLQRLGSYVIQFLPKADKPAVIPPELQRKLPKNMYSIRVRVTQNWTDIEKAMNGSEAKAEEGKEEVERTEQQKMFDAMSEAEKKKFMLLQQKKLIDKIKFAEKLRDLIIIEEKKGTPTDKFSVSRDGIEKALKRYKTQLWKAYTGNNNLSITQLKQAVQKAKATGEKGDVPVSTDVQPISRPQSTSTVSLATLARIQSNQGLHFVCPQNTQSNIAQAAALKTNQFISLSSLQANMLSAGITPGEAIVSNTQSVNASSALSSGTSTSSACLTVKQMVTDTSLLHKTVVKPQQNVHPVSKSLDTSSVVSQNSSTSSSNAAQPVLTAQQGSKHPTSSSEELSLKKPSAKSGMPVKSSALSMPPTLAKGITTTSALVVSSMTTMPQLSRHQVTRFTPNPTTSTTTYTMTLASSSSLPFSAGTVLTPSNPLPHLAGSEVLLIPLGDNGQSNWSRQAAPVLSAKVSVLPSTSTTVCSNNVNVSSKSKMQSGVQLIGSPQVCLTGVSPAMSSPLTVFAAKGQNLNGKQLLLQANKPGSSQLIMNTIQPVNSSSPLYGQVKNMRFPFQGTGTICGTSGMSLNHMTCSMPAMRMTNTTAYPPKIVANPPTVTGPLTFPQRQVIVFPTSGNLMPSVSTAQGLDSSSNISSPQDAVPGTKRKRNRKSAKTESEGSEHARDCQNVNNVTKNKRTKKQNEASTDNKDEKITHNSATSNSSVVITTEEKLQISLEGQKTSPKDADNLHIKTVINEACVSSNQTVKTEKADAKLSVAKESVNEVSSEQVVLQEAASMKVEKGNSNKEEDKENVQANEDAGMPVSEIVQSPIKMEDVGEGKAIIETVTIKRNESLEVKDSTVPENQVSKCDDKIALSATIMSSEVNDSATIISNASLETSKEDLKQGGYKQNGASCSNHVDTVVTVESELETVMQDGYKQKEFKQGCFKQDKLKQGSKQIEFKQDGCKQDEFEQDGAKQEESKQEDFKQEDAADPDPATEEEIRLQIEVENILHNDSDSNGGSDSLAGSVKSFGSLGDMVEITDLTGEHPGKGLTSDSPIPGCSDSSVANGVAKSGEIASTNYGSTNVCSEIMGKDGNSMLVIHGVNSEADGKQELVVVSKKEHTGNICDGNLQKRKAVSLGDTSIRKGRKRARAAQMRTAAESPVLLDDSEESDVDIISVDKEQITLSQKRNAKAPIPEADKVILTTPSHPKQHKEKQRRVELRYRFKELETLVYKYSPNVSRPIGQQERTKAVILRDALKLLNAMTEKSNGLVESIEDGLQCQQRLNEELSKKKKYFIDMGIPEAVLNNFLKGVKTAFWGINKKRKKRDIDSTAEDTEPFLDILLDNTGEGFETAESSPIVYMDDTWLVEQDSLQS